MRIGSDTRGLRLYSPDLVMRARPAQEDDKANAASEARKAAVREMIPEDKSSSDISAQERQVLAREQALKSRVPGGSAHTTYTYAMGPDGKRYIVGAEVSIIAPEDELEAATGGRGRPAGTKLSAESTSEEAANTPEEKAKAAEQNPETAAQIAKLQQTEREVVAHEAAHMAVGGQFAGSASYSYTTGPDGKRYITGGEVPISTPATDDPEEALRNAEQVMRAAMAPANPSGQDIAVAAGAAQTAAQARLQVSEEQDAGEGEGASGEAGKSETPSFDSYRGGQAKRAYASTESPKGLWTASGGYEPRTGQTEETAPDSLRDRDLEGIAA